MSDHMIIEVDGIVSDYAVAGVLVARYMFDLLDDIPSAIDNQAKTSIKLSDPPSEEELSYWLLYGSEDGITWSGDDWVRCEKDPLFTLADS